MHAHVRLLIVSMCLFWLCASPPAVAQRRSAVRTAERPVSLVAHWDFDPLTDDIDLGVVRDKSGNRHNGVLFGGDFVDGLKGKALGFDGKSTFVNLPTDPLGNLHVAGGSFECWLNVLSFEGRDCIHVYDKGKSGVSNYFRVGIVPEPARGGYRGHERQLEVRLDAYYGTVESSGAYLYSTTRLQKNRWYHIVVSWTEITRELYLNGRLECKTTRKARLGPVGHVSNAVGAPAGATPGSTPDFFHGILDEVRIFDGPLSSEQIREHYEELAEIAASKSAAGVDTRICPKCRRKYDTAEWQFCPFDGTHLEDE